MEIRRERYLRPADARLNFGSNRPIDTVSRPHSGVKETLLMIYGNGDDDNTWGRMILGGSQSRAEVVKLFGS